MISVTYSSYITTRMYLLGLRPRKPTYVSSRNLAGTQVSSATELAGEDWRGLARPPGGAPHSKALKTDLSLVLSLTIQLVMYIILLN